MKASRRLGLAALAGVPLAAYAGYPVLVWAASILRPRHALTDPTIRPPVTFVIAAFNEAALIGAKVRNVFELDYPHDRVTCIVVCDGCTDDTANVARAAADSRLKVIELPYQQGKLAAIRAALPHARGEIVAFSDANAKLDRVALRHLVAPFADPSVTVVSGAKHVFDGPEALYWRYERWIRALESASGSIAGADGALYAVRATTIDASPCAGAADDLLISLRAAKMAGRIVLAPAARTVEASSPAAARTLATRARTISGALFALQGLPELLHPGRGDLWWKLAGHKLLRIATPPAILAGTVASVSPVRLARPPIWAAIASLIIGSTLLGLQTTGQLRRVWPLARYALLANLGALAGLVRFIVRRPTDAWSPARRQVSLEPLGQTPATRCRGM